MMRLTPREEIAAGIEHLVRHMLLFRGNMLQLDAKSRIAHRANSGICSAKGRGQPTPNVNFGAEFLQGHGPVRSCLTSIEAVGPAAFLRLVHTYG